MSIALPKTFWEVHPDGEIYLEMPEIYRYLTFHMLEIPWIQKSAMLYSFDCYDIGLILSIDDPETPFTDKFTR
jgi:hypothetical protein